MKGWTRTRDGHAGEDNHNDGGDRVKMIQLQDMSIVICFAHLSSDILPITYTTRLVTFFQANLNVCKLKLIKIMSKLVLKVKIVNATLTVDCSIFSCKCKCYTKREKVSKMNIILSIIFPTIIMILHSRFSLARKTNTCVPNSYVSNFYSCSQSLLFV